MLRTISPADVADLGLLSAAVAIALAAVFLVIMFGALHQAAILRARREELPETLEGMLAEARAIGDAGFDEGRALSTYELERINVLLAAIEARQVSA